MLRPRIERDGRSDTNTHDHMRFHLVQMIDRLIRRQQEELPSWVHGYRNISGKCHSDAHPHLHLFGNRQFDAFLNRHFRQRG